MKSVKWSFARPATTCESVRRPNPAERPFQPKLGFCTGLTKPAIATRVLYEIPSYFLWFIGTLWVIDSTSKDYWSYYKIVIFGLEKEKPGIQNMSHAGALRAPGPRWGENSLLN